MMLQPAPPTPMIRIFFGWTSNIFLLLYPPTEILNPPEANGQSVAHRTYPPKISHRHRLRQPDLIHRQKEYIPVLYHPLTVYRIDYRFSMTAADSFCGLNIRRKMHVQAAFRNKPLFLNRRRKLLSCPMIQNDWRGLFLQLHIHWSGMPLIGPDECVVFVVGIALLLVRPDDLLQKRHVQMMFSCCIDAFDHILDTRLPMFIQRDSGCFRLMPEDQRCMNLLISPLRISDPFCLTAHFPYHASLSAAVPP